MGRRTILNGQPVVVIESACPMEGADFRTALGFYRAGGADELSAQDRQIVNFYMRGAPSVFLLIQVDRAASTLFFFYEGNITRVGQTAWSAPGSEALPPVRHTRLNWLHRGWLTIGAMALMILGMAAVGWRNWLEPLPRPLPVAMNVLPPPIDLGRMNPSKQTPMPRARPAIPRTVRRTPALPVALQPPAPPPAHHPVLTAPLRFAKWLFHAHRRLT